MEDVFALHELGLQPVSRDNLLGHLRPVHQYRVDLVASEVSGNVEVKRYLISGMRRDGADVLISLRLFLRHPADPRIVLTLPGGAGRVDDKLVTWLAAYFDANHAVVDWVGRGQSGQHEGLAGVPDPLFMNGDTFRDCFQFYNVSGIWSALNWLFHAGFQPTDLTGGSWGGVYCFLMAALDRRVQRIFPSFGCGGFAIRGIEKRSYWDVAIEHIGPAKFAEWCAAFDPIARIGDLKAEVFFETATNDKFFSLDMAMQTWRRIERPGALRFAYNQDHTMGPSGLQPYLLQALPSDHSLLEKAREAGRTTLYREPGSNVISCSPVEQSEVRLVVSEQLPAHGNMSREWRAHAPARGPADSIRFEVIPTSRDSRLLYYLDHRIAFGNQSFQVTTPLYGAGAAEFVIDRRISPSPLRYVLDARSERLLDAPVGDKVFPKIIEEAGAWSISFTGAKRLRATRFGVRPWLLPRHWSSIHLQLADALDERSAGLQVVLSKKYNHRDEQICVQRFAAAEAVQEGRNWRYRFSRDGFARAKLLDGRFGIQDFCDGSDITASFDSVGIRDVDGGSPFSIRLISIMVE